MKLDRFLKASIHIAFHLLFLLTPLIWTSRTSELFELPKMFFVYTMTIIIAGAWSARMVIHKKLLLTKTPLDTPLFFFFISQSISTLLSLNPHTSLFGYYSRFNGGLLSTICYITLYYALVSNDTHDNTNNKIVEGNKFVQSARTRLNAWLATLAKVGQQFRSFADKQISVTPTQALSYIRSLLIGATLATLYALPEHFGISPSCLILRGDLSVSCWIQDVQSRIFGTFGQPNWLAAYLIAVIFLPLSYLLFHLTRSLNFSKRSRHPERAWRDVTSQAVVGLFIFILFFTTLLFTKSRSGLLGFGIGLMVFLAISSKKLIPYLLFLALIGSVLAYKTVSPSDNSLASQGGTESAAIRKIVWKGALKVWQKYPVFGSGVETFAYAYYPVRPIEHNLVSEWDFLYNKAHNEFLNLAATTGAFGLSTYLFLIFSYVKWSLAKIRYSPHLISPTSTALLCGYLALTVSNFFGFSTVPISLLFFLLPALAFLLHTDQEERDQFDTTGKLSKPVLSSRAAWQRLDGRRHEIHDTQTHPLQWLAISAVILSTAYCVLLTLHLLQADLHFAAGKRFAQNQDLNQAAQELTQAVSLFANEPVFTNELSVVTAQLARAVYEQNNPQFETLITIAIRLSDETLKKNPVHLNFYKDRARLFVELANIDPKYLKNARDALVNAAKIAPTDAKVWFNLAVLENQLGNTDRAQKILDQTLKLKPDYQPAKAYLATINATATPSGNSQ